MSDSTQKQRNSESPTGSSNEFDPAADPGATAADGESSPVAADILHLKQELENARQQVLRARAEFANYQKRAKQQADSDRAYAVGSLARDLLEPLDNLERAIEVLRASATREIISGLDMVQKQLVEVLGKHGVEPIAAHGQPFDPNLHDALVRQPSHEHPEGTVVAELTKGYTIRDRVLRPSKVSVSVKPTQEGN